MPSTSTAFAPFDVVICGAGLAGLTLARQLRRAQPQLRLLVAERTTRPLAEAAHKVGESSVELGSQYLEQLGLRGYLLERHLVKFGLRFFPGGGQLPLHQRCEIGAEQEPVVSSYQLDRGRLENDLREMLVADGVTLLEGVTVKQVALQAAEPWHEVELWRGEERLRVQGRWVVDATGRNALLRRQLKLTRGSRHLANASWFRVAGKVDLNDFVPADVRAWHDAPWAPHRWRSTNHLMGEGYWAWIIPLASGNTSIGVVVHDASHAFDQLCTLERTRAFLATHEPQLAAQLATRQVLDFGCLRHYSHGVARAWSAERWAIVGEAGAFVDPLYSPGTDFIAFANTFTEEMLRTDLAGGDLTQRAQELNLLYRALVNGNVDVYRSSAQVYGHAPAMLAKVYWDNFAYWSYPCQLFLQELYRLQGAALHAVTAVGQRFVELSGYVQALLAAWAELAPAETTSPDRLQGSRAMPAFPSVLIEAHLALQQRLSPQQTLELMQQRAGEAETIAAELLLRVLSQLGDDLAPLLAERLRLPSWELRLPESRLAALHAVGLARRRVLGPLARDVERSLGASAVRTSEALLRRLLQPLLRPQQRQPAEAHAEPQLSL